jgi:RES domain-containing protein
VVSALARLPLAVEEEATGGVDSARRPVASASRAAAASAVAVDLEKGWGEEVSEVEANRVLGEDWVAEAALASRPAEDSENRPVASTSRAVVALGGVEVSEEEEEGEDLVAREGSRAAVARAGAVLSEEINLPSARRPNHHLLVVWEVVVHWAVGWEESPLVDSATRVAVDSENQLVDLASQTAAALVVVADWEEAWAKAWVEACKKDNNQAALAVLDYLRSEVARALVPSLRLEMAAEALVEQKTA